MKISVYPGSERYSTRTSDGVTHHSFSFGQHYDPENLTFGPMRAHNEHRLSWGAGFAAHRHSEVELVTWVLHGQVVHTDSLGHASRLPAGTVQVQSAGSGIEHSEFADTDTEPTRFVQAWLEPDEGGRPPARFVSSGMRSDSLRPVAGEGAQVPIGTTGATLWAGALKSGSTHELPVCAAHHLFIASGSAHLEAPGQQQITLTSGDAARITGADDADMVLKVTEAAEVMLWTFRTTFDG